MQAASPSLYVDCSSGIRKIHALVRCIVFFAVVSKILKWLADNKAAEHALAEVAVHFKVVDAVLGSMQVFAFECHVIVMPSCAEFADQATL